MMANWRVILKLINYVYQNETRINLGIVDVGCKAELVWSLI